MSNPTVTVMVVETVPPLIYVMGEVNSAGPQPLVGKMDVMQALASAKGFRDFANTKNILIQRGSQVLTFNYNDAVKGKAAPIYLQPGDTVVVK
jgi:polysaccharide export outer membrane protein